VSKRPELKQFGDLTPEDFQRYPVWLHCHVADYDEPWYDETDEETFRPWLGRLPADRAVGTLLVRASVVFQDGSHHVGFLTPSADRDLGMMQPQVFVGGHLFSFWGGMPGVPEDVRRSFYAAIGKDPDAIFPLRVVADSGLLEGEWAVEVRGFYRTPDLKQIEVER
jgi:hypothetical protein